MKLKVVIALPLLLLITACSIPPVPDSSTTLTPADALTTPATVITTASQAPEITEADPTMLPNATQPEPSSTPAPKRIVWSAMHENGDISEWKAQGDFIRQGYSGSYHMVSPHAHEGQFSVSLSIDTQAPSDSGSHAAYLMFWNQLPEEAYYYSAWYYIPSVIQPDQWWTIWQWKSTFDGNSDNSKPMYSLGVEVGDDYRFLRLIYRPDLENKIPFTQTKAPLPRDRWFQIEAYYAKSPTKGEVIIWQDGLEIFNVDSLPTVLRDGTVYWSVNNYADKISPSPATIYVDEVIISLDKISP